MRVRKICLAAALVLAMALLITGCGKASDKVAEKAAETAIEKATGGQAQVDIGKGGALEVKTTEGSVSVGGGDYKWPDKIPADVPRLAEGKITSLVESENTSDAKYSVFIGMDNVNEAAYDKYKNDLAQAGWSIVLSNKSDKEIILVAAKGKHNLSVNFRKSGNQGFSGGITYAETK